MILAVAGIDVASAADVERAIAGRKPGDQVSLVFARRGQRVTGTLHLVEDPRVEVVPVEGAGRVLTQEERRFRDAWLNSPARITQ